MERFGVRLISSRGQPNKAAGLFVSHVRTKRIVRHYARLKEQTRGLVDWRFLYNPSPFWKGRSFDPQALMPKRYLDLQGNGGLIGGYLDTLLVPATLHFASQQTWIVEYDVDYSGCWRTFFEQFRDSSADFLSTTIVSQAETPQWYWWSSARAPEELPPTAMLRSFCPIMRLSRRFAMAYVEQTAVSHWRGHYEFTLPTLAAASNFEVRDLGGSRPNERDRWSTSNYVNEPKDDRLMPGTFRWRPAQQWYFHERPADFKLPDMLYHPIKPATVEPARGMGR